MAFATGAPAPLSTVRWVNNTGGAINYGSVQKMGSLFGVVVGSDDPSGGGGEAGAGDFGAGGIRGGLGALPPHQSRGRLPALERGDRDLGGAGAWSALAGDRRGD